MDPSPVRSYFPVRPQLSVLGATLTFLSPTANSSRCVAVPQFIVAGKELTFLAGARSRKSDRPPRLACSRLVEEVGLRRGVHRESLLSFLSSLKPELTNAFPQFITPIGIAIGIGVHSSYNPNSGAALLSIGILDSISAGILLYAGLVELLYHDVSSLPSVQTEIETDPTS